MKIEKMHKKGENGTRVTIYDAKYTRPFKNMKVDEKTLKMKFGW